MNNIELYRTLKRTLTYFSFVIYQTDEEFRINSFYIHYLNKLTPKIAILITLLFVKELAEGNLYSIINIEEQLNI